MTGAKQKLWGLVLTWLLLPGNALAGEDPQTLYQTRCTACHGFGIAGAPRLGNSADWAGRLDKGRAQIYKNAIQGYSGENGVMPPKGGFTKLSDDQIRKIVDYMVEALEPPQ